MLSVLGIVVALVLLITLAYRGVSILILAPLLSAFAVLFSADAHLLASYTQVFMKALGGFVITYFPLFLLGAVFGKLMDASGSARTISAVIARVLGRQQAVLAIVLSCAILTYGGVSLFVVAFAVYPIAQALFSQAGVPRRLMPATIALGSFTFTMTALPGTPAIQNAIPMPYFGTTPFAAPGLGILGGAIMLVLGMAWLSWRTRQAHARGERDEPVASLQDGAGRAALAVPASTPASTAEASPDAIAKAPSQAIADPGFAAAVLPVLLVIVANLVFTNWLIPGMDTAYLAEPRYGGTSVAAVGGLWAIIAALVVSITMLIGLHWRRLHRLADDLEAGASSAVLPILNTASQVGFGAVIASLAGFVVIRDAVLAIAPDNPLISLSVAVNVLAGITGSASGGMSIALQTLGDTYLALGREAGIEPALLHRVTAIATGGLDALPHNGAVITLLGICQLTHRQSYFDIFMVAAAFPLVSLVAVVTMGSLWGAF